MSADSAGARRPALDRACIVAAAREAIIKHGLEAFSLRRLATELGVTAPALYAHVSGKRELVGAVAEVEFQRFLERLGRAEPGDPLARIRADCRAYVDHARENPELFGLMLRFRPVLTREPRGDEFAAATRLFQRGSAAVQDAIDRGLFATDDGLTASLTLWTAIQGYVSLLLSGAELDPDQEEKLFDSLMHTLLTGLRAPQEERCPSTR